MKSEYVIVAESSSTTRFAARELQKYLQQSCGAILPIVDSSAGPAIVLKQTSSNSDRDQYSVTVKENDIHITGNNARSVLYGVYAFLETFVGIGFYASEYEYVPERQTIHVPADYQYHQTARFAVRQISTEWSFDEAMVDWAVKNRFNCICASMAFWRGEHGGDVLAAAQARGMSIGLTGHVLFELVNSNEYFQDHPEWFPEIDGTRTPTRHSGDNFCFSNAEAVTMLAENLKRFCDQFPPLSSISLWPGDGGLVCTCPACRNTPFMVLYGKAVAQVAEILSRSHPQIKVSQLAYNFLTPDLSLEMLRIPEETEHVPTMFAFWGQNLTAPLETNPDANHRTVLHHIEDYCRRRPGDGTIFSYHTDTYMNSNLCPIFEPAMSADFPLFQRFGVDQVCLLWIPWDDVRSDITLWIARQNGCLYGRCAMNEHFDIERYRCDYFTRVFGQDRVEVVKTIWNALNDSLKPLFELTWSSAPYRFSDGWGCGFNRSVLKWELTTDYREIGKKRLATFQAVVSNLTKHRAQLAEVDTRYPEPSRLREYYEHCLQRAKGLTFIFQAQYAMQAEAWREAADLLQGALDTGMESEKEQTLEWQAYCQKRLEEQR